MIGSPHSPAHHPVGSPHWTLELNSAQQQFQRFTMVSCSSIEVPIETLLNELSIEIPVSSFSFRPPRCLKISILHFVQNYFNLSSCCCFFCFGWFCCKIFSFESFSFGASNFLLSDILPKWEFHWCVLWLLFTLARYLPEHLPQNHYARDGCCKLSLVRW